MISANMLIKTDSGSVLRVLWLDEKTDEVFTIDILTREALPEIGKLSDIEKALKRGKLTEVIDDPWKKADNDSKINAKRKQIRDKAYQIVNYIANQKPEIYYRRTRGSLVKQATERFGISKVMLYKYLRRYWQRGQNKNALLPDYDNSGGKGKPKTAGQKKLGRPRKDVNLGGQGINVTPEVRNIFSKAIKKYYMPNESGSLKKVYNLLIKKSYGSDEPNIPTFTQFKYWFTKEGHKEKPKPQKPKIKQIKPPKNVKRLVDEMEKPLTLDIDKQIDFYINKGFEAKYQGNHDLAIKYFSAVLNLGPAIDLEIMLVFDIVGMLKGAVKYRDALDILYNLVDKGSELSAAIIRDVNTNIKLLENLIKR